MRIIHATIYSMEQEPIQDGFLHFENGIIVGMGKTEDIAVHPDDYDACGGYLLPGLVDIHTALGLKEECSRFEGNDFNESSNPITPHMRALDGFFAGDKAIDIARRAGVTAAVTMPGNMNLIGGQAMAVRLSRKTTADMCMRASCGIKFALGEEPRAAYGAYGKPPLTRMAQAYMLRSTLEAAKKAMEIGRGTDQQKALFPLLSGKAPAYFHANREDDIEAAVRLSKEFGFRLIIVHGADSGIMANYLATEKVPVVVGALTLCNARMESIHLGPEIPNQLYKCGVRFAITSDHHQSPLYLLAVSAAFAVREGLPVKEALKAITIYPAEIAGLDDQIGSLKEGKYADMALYSEFPLNYHARTKQVWIGGEMVL